MSGYCLDCGNEMCVCNICECEECKPIPAMTFVSFEAYEKLQAELQSTREQLEKATNLLRLQLYAISPSDIMSTEKLVKDFLSKNKQKDEVK